MVDIAREITDKPWLAVIAAVAVGILIGCLVSCCHKCWRRRSGGSGDAEEPWECVDVLGRCCSEVLRLRQHGVNSCFKCLVLTRKSLVTTLAMVTLCLTASCLATAIMLRTRFVDMRANMVGDPERKIVDECMRDFEGLPLDSEEYMTEHRKCVEELAKDESLTWLPRVRLTVDERVCSPANLCRGAPDECDDEGEVGDSDYRQGTVSRCYRLISDAKASRDYLKRADMLTVVERDCTGRASWEDYDEKVLLQYCMWKHMGSGLCMNNMRTSCVEDGSCCPIAENSRGGRVVRNIRRNQYECRASPTVGLFCQHVDDRVAVPANSAMNATDMPLCTEETCSSFSWCQDLADVPGLCLGEACQEYQRCIFISVVMIVCCSLALVLDLVYAGTLMCCPVGAGWRGSTNFIGACLKVLVWAFCVAGGLFDFIDNAIHFACFNAPGNMRVEESKMLAHLVRIFALVTTGGSVLLSPISMRYGTRLMILPYAKGQTTRGGVPPP